MTVVREVPKYHDTVEKLNSTQSGFKALREKRLGGRLDKATLEDVRQWLHRVGHDVNDLNRLNVVHVAGTKGKGSTCAFVNSILQRYQQSVGIPRKIGLYTSPHLVTVRERIQVNSEPISEEMFAQYFFEVWDALESSAIKEGLDPARKPTYFRFLTLMAFHIFIREGIDAAVIEVGVGGELDSTNIIPLPAVTGITTLGIDHVRALGGTIDKIAWHKAGIFKAGSPAFTVPQAPEAMEVLRSRAEEKGVKLDTLAIHPALFDIRLRVAEDFQRKNASLAIALAASLLNRLGVSVDIDSEPLPREFIEGLENMVWRGRWETLVSDKQVWHLDGAHTEDSLKLSTAWFARTATQNQHKDGPRSIPTVLIFNQQSTRDSESLLRTVHETAYNDCGIEFQHAVFCTNTTYKGNSCKTDFVNRNVDPKELGSLSLQTRMAEVWHTLDPRTQTATFPSIEQAIEHTESITCEAGQTLVLVTGSLHLVGGVLALLEGKQYIGC